MCNKFEPGRELFRLDIVEAWRYFSLLDSIRKKSKVKLKGFHLNRTHDF